MTTTVLPVRLREFYDHAIGELNPRRGNTLTNDFQSKIGDAVFKAGCSALTNFATDTHRLMTVSAPCGTCKTSFAYALAAAITRLAEHDPSAPYGIVFLVEQKEQADSGYRELIQLLPENVRVWTEDHDLVGNKSDNTKVHNPAARCSKADLAHAPVIIVTQAFYLGKNGHQRANQGDLGAMDTLRSKPKGVTTISDGHVLRQIVQLASRGNLRNYDEHGVCGKMRLLIACDMLRFMTNVDVMFPGVRHDNIKIVGGVSDSDNVQTKVLRLLSSTSKDVLPTKEISRHFEREWRSVSHYVNTPSFDRSCRTIGWKYIPNKGCKGACFRRLSSKQSEYFQSSSKIGVGVLSAYM